MRWTPARRAILLICVAAGPTLRWSSIVASVIRRRASEPPRPRRPLHGRRRAAGAPPRAHLARRVRELLPRACADAVGTRARRGRNGRGRRPVRTRHRLRHDPDTGRAARPAARVTLQTRTTPAAGHADRGHVAFQEVTGTGAASGASLAAAGWNARLRW